MEFEEKPEGSGSRVDENQLDLGEKHQANRKPGASGKAKLSARQQANAKCDLPRKSLNRYTWQEIQRHNQKTDQWLVINRKIYDVTGWADRHPGGRQVLKHYAGEDATDVFRAMHPDPDIVRLYLKSLLIGELAPEEPNQERNKNSRLVEDFQELRRTLETLNMFNANLGFFFLHLAQILILEALAWVIMWHFGSGWLITIFISFLLTVAQAQGLFLQHDMGHLSIFKKSKWNRLMHKFVMGHLKYSCLDNPMNRMKWRKDMTRKDEVPGKPFNVTVIEVYAPNTNAKEAEVEWFNEDLQDRLELKLKKAVLCIKGGWDVKAGNQEIPGITGVVLTWNLCSWGLSAKWWNNRHFQHHVKTNIYPKDPDIDTGPFFVIGDLQPVEYGKNRIKFFDYEKQHLIFCLVSPFLIAVYFNLESILHMCRRRHWEDIAWAISFYIRNFITFGPFYGIFRTMVLIYSAKFLESVWITYVTQMSHIPMKISKEENRDWFSSQVLATCNVEHSFFNDWFTGHLNFQIEHHLFPTMPRHNYHKVAPLVKSLCAKHGLPYVKKPMLKAFGDILRALKKYGALWKEAYCTHPEI